MRGKQRKVVEGKKQNHKCFLTEVTSSTRVKFKRFKILLVKILTLFILLSRLAKPHSPSGEQQNAKTCQIISGSPFLQSSCLRCNQGSTACDSLSTRQDEKVDLTVKVCSLIIPRSSYSKAIATRNRTKNLTGPCP